MFVDCRGSRERADAPDDRVAAQTAQLHVQNGCGGYARYVKNICSDFVLKVAEFPKLAYYTVYILLNLPI